MDVGGLIGLLIWLVVLGVIFYVLWWGLSQIGLPEPIGKVVRVVLVLIVVLVLVYLLLGVLPPLHALRLR